mmetsp:Transcript_402/g.443  ORF Transcript_402/g.443 Transcript_402/m.443 type:complete len:517 (+) Transcript_402:123-1673(+)
MFDIKVSDSANYNKDNSLTFTKIFVIFDNVEQFRHIHDYAHVLRIIGFSDEAQLQQFVALEKKVSPGTDAASTVESFFFTGEGKNLTKIVISVLPTACSRHNTPARSHAVGNVVKAHKSSENTIVIVVPSSEDRAYAQAVAVGRQFPLFSLKSGDAASSSTSIKVDVVINFPSNSQNIAHIVSSSQSTIEGVRLAQKLVDSPPNILHSDAYVEICRSVAESLKSEIRVIQGKDLKDQGFGGLYGVGQAAEHAPALVVLSYYPPSTTASADSSSVCLVGKGIIYDTGGLSIKTPTTSMAGMKIDMAGSAAVLGAFATAVSLGNLKKPLHGLLCIAENSIGPNATRPDDIHTLLSGKTVEVNNTDAEGRLVLSDGVFYAHKFLHANVIVDIATLTGAQGIATGKNHGAIYCNSDELEGLAVASGKYTGDLTFPIPYVPEFYRNEFRSVVADMKNSVADRSNAQSSCAGQFIGNHLEEFLNKGGQWLHVDMASPASSGERATGYGVALLYELTRRLNQN